MYKRVLVPLDGSELAEVVFDYVEELAGRLELDIILLHVSGPREHDLLPMHRAYIERAAEIVERKSIEIQEKTRAKPGGRKLEVRGELAIGHAAEEILRYADENNVDIILIATHGRSGVKRWAIGSVADKVLRASNVPVWLVRAGILEEIVRDKWPKRTMLVPLDGSKLAESVLPHVEALAKQCGDELCDVVLLRVCEPPVISTDYPEAIMELSWEEHVEQEKAWHKRAGERYLAEVGKRFSDAGLRVRSEVLLGRPIDEIIEYANKNPINLIILATHGRTGVVRWAYGQVTDKVLQRSTSPIFLVRPH
jgi:nucleotide-binding universal stress UspA family protein